MNLNALTSRLAATQTGGGAPGAAAAAGAAVDPVEELTKLADLRDRGVLTNDIQNGRRGFTGCEKEIVLS